MGRGKFAAFGLMLSIAACLLAIRAEAQAPVWTKIQLKWAGAAGTSALTDTTFLEDEVDTTRTEEYSMGRVDWAALAQVQGSSSGPLTIPVYFEAQVSDGNADTIYFNVEKKIQTTGIWSANRTLTAGVGNCALNTGVQSHADRVFEGQLQVDIDTPGKNNIWLAPIIRLRVAGDQSGTTPALSGLRCFIVVPIRAGS